MELLSPRDSRPQRDAEWPAYIDLCRGYLCVDLKISAMIARSLCPPAASERPTESLVRPNSCTAYPHPVWGRLPGCATCLVVQVVCSEGHGLSLMLLFYHHLEILNNCNF